METATRISSRRREEWIKKPTEGEKCEEGNRELHIEGVEVEVVSWGSRREKRLVENQTPRSYSSYMR